MKLKNKQTQIWKNCLKKWIWFKPCKNNAKIQNIEKKKETPNWSLYIKNRKCFI